MACKRLPSCQCAWFRLLFQSYGMGGRLSSKIQSRIDFFEPRRRGEGARAGGVLRRGRGALADALPRRRRGGRPRGRGVRRAPRGPPAVARPAAAVDGRRPRRRGRRRRRRRGGLGARPGRREALRLVDGVPGLPVGRRGRRHERAAARRLRPAVGGAARGARDAVGPRRPLEEPPRAQRPARARARRRRRNFVKENYIRRKGMKRYFEKVKEEAKELIELINTSLEGDK